MPPSNPRLRGERTKITISVKNLLKSSSDEIFSEIPVSWGQSSDNEMLTSIFLQILSCPESEVSAECTQCP